MWDLRSNKAADGLELASHIVGRVALVPYQSGPTEASSRQARAGHMTKQSKCQPCSSKACSAPRIKRSWTNEKCVQFISVQ